MIRNDLLLGNPNRQYQTSCLMNVSNNSGFHYIPTNRKENKINDARFRLGFQLRLIKGQKCVTCLGLRVARVLDRCPESGRIKFWP